jgi:transmembrane protein 70, mitochondrial
VIFFSDISVHNFSTWKQYFPTSPTSPLKLTNFTYFVHSFTQSRPASQATGSKIVIGPEPKRTQLKEEKEPSVVYVGPISSTIKKVKLLSLSTCCLSVSLGPVITFMTSPEMNVILKGGVASTVIFLSASTTAALHWFISPYIHKLRWQPGSDGFEAEMMSWLATPLRRTIKFAEVRRPDTNRPFVTFKADGKYYFVDAEHFQNKALLARLTPEKGSHESAFKNL